MSNNNLLKSLMLRMQNERFNPNIINCRYFKELPNNLINSLLRLNRNDFRQYVLFISLLKEKHLLACNSENLIRLSNIFIFKMRFLSTKYLMNLLVKTNLLNHPQLIEFSSILLQIETNDKLKAISNILTSSQDVCNLNIVSIISFVKRVKNYQQLESLVQIIKNPVIRKHKNYLDFVELILNNPQNSNLDLIAMALNNNVFSKHPKVINLLQFLLKSQTKEQAELIYEIIINESMLKSFYLEKVLGTIMRDDTAEYFPYLRKIIIEKKYLSDAIFDKVLNTLFKANSKIQMQTVLDILKHQELLDKEDDLYYLLETTLKIDKGFKRIAFNSFIEKVVSLDNFDFLNSTNMTLIEGILKSSKDYQAFALANSSCYLEKFPFVSSIVEEIIKEESPIVVHGISILLSIPNISELPNLFAIINELKKVKNEYQMKAIIAILMQEKVIKSNKYIQYIKLIIKAKKDQIDSILEIISSMENLFDPQLEKFLEDVTMEFDFDKLELITIIILNYPFLGVTKAKELILKLKNTTRKNYKEIINQVKRELESIDYGHSYQVGGNSQTKKKKKVLAFES